LSGPAQVDEEEKRHSLRFPWAVEMRGTCLSPLEVSEKITVSLAGVTENIGAGGVGVLTDQLLSPDAVLRCEFALSDNPVLMPTLMRVRWSNHDAESTGHYRIGLQFLL
jgi:hypothetical protein